MNNVVKIRPTLGLSRLEQLRAFVQYEREVAPDKIHIAEWALCEIERLLHDLRNAEYAGHLLMEVVERQKDTIGEIKEAKKRAN